MAPIPYDRMYLLGRPDVRPSPRPYIMDKCQSDLDKLCPTAHQQAVLKAKIQKRMKFFQDHPSDFSRDNPLFEHFATYSDRGTPLQVYVMRFNKDKTIGNLRIFFVVKENEMYMLHAFLEKGKKTYGPAYDVVKTRLS